MALNKEIWVDQIAQNWYPEGSFLKNIVDMSAFVDAHKLHYPSIGIDPQIFINNNTYPMTAINRHDIDNEFTLDKFETENSYVNAAESVELSYDKLESVLKQYRAVLQLATAKKAIHAFAPLSNTLNTPVLECTGTAKDGRKTLTIDDILTLKEKFDDAVIDPQNRSLVLHPKHVSDLLRADVELFKDITDLKNGVPYRFAGFAIYSFSYMPTYRNVDGIMKKVAFGADVADGDVFCSVAFQNGEVFKADGEINMYSTINDPSYRGTIVGFDKRFIAMPIRNKGIGAIISSVSE